MDDEIWRPVPGYEGLYEVSNHGNVKSLFRYKKTLKWNITPNGYATVELFKDKTSKRLLVHRLVASAFLDNSKGLPQVNHKDENKLNNSVSNLEWCTAKENMNYGEAAKTRYLKIDYSKPIYAINARRNGAVMSKPVLQFSKDGKLINRFASGKEAHRETGLNHSHILECCNGKRYKTVGGFIWRFEEGRNDLLESRSS